MGVNKNIEGVVCTEIEFRIKGREKDRKMEGVLKENFKITQ